MEFVFKKKLNVDFDKRPVNETMKLCVCLMLSLFHGTVRNTINSDIYFYVTLMNQKSK